MAKSKNFHHKRSVAPKPTKKISRNKFFVFFFLVRLITTLLYPFRRILRIIFLALSLWLFCGALIFGLSFFSYQETKAQYQLQRQEQEERLNSWKNILREHPTSREALLGAYESAINLGSLQEAERFREQLMRIDPNDPRVKNLEN